LSIEVRHSIGFEPVGAEVVKVIIEN
jgi:hypothetical protein